MAVFGGIGDVLLASPALFALRAAYPQARITLITEARSRSVGALLPVDVCLPLETRDKLSTFLSLVTCFQKSNPDLAIATGRSPAIALALAISGAKTRVGYGNHPLSRWFLTHAPLANGKIYASQMHWALAEAVLPNAVLQDDASKGLRRLRPSVIVPSEFTLENPYIAQWPVGARRKVLIHPGASRLSVQKNILKQWPTRHWLTLIQTLLADTDTAVGVCGGPDDAEVIAALRQALGTTPGWILFETRHLTDLALLMQSADVVTCIDSAPMHLSVALDKPTVALFGPTDPTLLMPDAQHTNHLKAVFRADLPCRPCFWAVRQESCDTPECLEVPVQSVLKAIDEVLAL